MFIGDGFSRRREKELLVPRQHLPSGLLESNSRFVLADFLNMTSFTLVVVGNH